MIRGTRITHPARDHEETIEDPPSGAGTGPAEPSGSGDPQDDDLDAYLTPSRRFLRAALPYIGVVVAIALVLPLGRGLIDAWLFGRAGEQVSEELDEALAAAVLLVRTTTCAGGVSSGSAFAADIDGRTVLLTNRHVVEGAAIVGLRTLTGSAGPRVQAWRLSSAADVALLVLEEAGQHPRPLAVAEDLPEVSTEIRTVGFPSALPFTTTGTVTDVARDRLHLEVRTEPGASGSPVLDGRGEVIGQIFARSDDGAGIATSAPAIRAALDRLEPERAGCG